MHETIDVLLYNNLFIYQVLFTLIYRRPSLYSFLSMGFCGIHRTLTGIAKEVNPSHKLENDIFHS